VWSRQVQTDVRRWNIGCTRLFFFFGAPPAKRCSSGSGCQVHQVVDDTTHPSTINVEKRLRRTADVTAVSFDCSTWQSTSSRTGRNVLCRWARTRPLAIHSPFNFTTSPLPSSHRVKTAAVQSCRRRRTRQRPKRSTTPNISCARACANRHRSGPPTAETERRRANRTNAGQQRRNQRHVNRAKFIDTKTATTAANRPAEGALVSADQQDLDEPSTSTSN
jgi:hypothetical protein